MKNIILVGYFMLTSVATFAQTGKISGEVLGSKQKAIEGAVVSLLKSKDSSFVKASITDLEGKYEFLNQKEGAYFLTITHVGFQKYTHPVFTLTGSALEIPSIQLVEDSKTLNEVTVSAKKPFVERRIDRTIVNPDALISNAGANSLEVLEKAPGVQVDFNGLISLKGKQGVVVFIDDKPTYLSASDLANYLRSLPSGSIETIEIMTNPPAKYDAAGNAGVINIKLKRNTLIGLNGGFNVNYGQGRYARTNNSLNFNYRINKINFFTNASYNINNTYQDLTITRQYFKPTGELNSGFTQNSYFKRQPSGANIKLGIDYYISKKVTMGLVFSALRNPNQTPIVNNARITNGKGELTSLNEAQVNPADKVFRNGSANVNFSYKFDSTGKELTTNLDYIAYDSEHNQSLLNNTFTPDGVFVGGSILNSSLPAKINIKTAKIDYSNPLKNGGKIETGFKTSFVNTENVAAFYDFINNQNVPNYEFSNNFIYDENINAAYLNYSIEGKKWGFQAGLRYESTDIKGNQLGNKVIKDSTFKRDYSSLFPTVYVSYKLDTTDTHQLGFSYGRRVERPDYQSMNPFTYPRDRFTLYGGNPFLRPTFSNNFEISHTYKGKITTTLEYSYLKDPINETIEQGTNIFYSRPGNVGEQNTFGLSISGGFKPAKSWTIQLYTEVRYNQFQGVLYNQNLNNSGTYWYFAPTNLFQISKLWSAELAGTYQTSAYSGQFVTISSWNVRVALARKVLKEKANLKFGVSDIFYTNQAGGEIKSLANSTASWYSYFDSRVATIAFGWRFNKGKTLKVRQSGGSEMEQNRVRG
jgi:iron complex outermembrane recepter protein